MFFAVFFSLSLSIFSLLYFSRIPFSNLLLVVIGPANQNHPKKTLGAEAKRINYTYLDDDTFPCHKKYLNNLERRRLDDCFTEDDRVCNENYHKTTIMIY